MTAQYKSTAIALSIAGTVVAPFQPLRAEFVPGHVFVSLYEGEGCFAGNEFVLDIDPLTGNVQVFADLDDGLCGASGLSFTPDGSGLRIASAGHVFPFDDGWVQEFDGDGNGTIILDGDDGLVRPYGVNTTVFDQAGNFYIVNADALNILRFPADGGPGEVFADVDDGISGRGSIAFSPNGDLYYVSDWILDVIQVDPAGNGRVFDTLPCCPFSIAIDKQANIFIVDGLTNIYRYEGGVPETRTVLASLYEDSAYVALALSPKEDSLYAATNEPGVYSGGTLFGIDTDDGSVSIVLDEFYGEYSALAFATGIAVVPCRVDNPSEDCNGNGVLDSCEGFDCNENGALDECDLANGTSPDCNTNSIPDECDGQDCDGNGQLYDCDIFDGAPDVDGDGIPDTCQCLADVNADLVVDPLDLGAVMAAFGLDDPSSIELFDVNHDGVIDPLDAGYVMARFGICP